jgi:VanZ family protein
VGHLAAVTRQVRWLWGLFGTPVAVAVTALPFAVVLVALLARHRRARGAEPGWALRSAFAEVFLVVGTVPWLWMILTPDPGNRRGHNLVPFHDLIHQFHVGLAYALFQVGGNLLVFAALGFCLPIRFRTGPVVVLVAGTLGSALVETLQWVLDLGRFSSVDDVIVNAAGAFAAAWLSRPWWRRRLDPALVSVPPEVPAPGPTMVPGGTDTTAVGPLNLSGHDR